MGLWVHVESTKKAQVRACARKLYQGDYTMKTQVIAKPSFKNTKAYGLCGTLALATALLIGAGSVSADETAQPVVDNQPTVSNVYTADNAGNVTVTPSETVQPVETAPVTETPVASTPTTETAPVTEPVAETPKQPTEFVKEGDNIQVTNPDVAIDQSNGDGKYSGFTVEYKDVKFPDDMAINEGDKVTFNLPKEITFQTNYDFDVKNPENNVVGKASTNVATQTVTTIFNDYFKNHPLNKQMSLKLDAKWTDAVESGKPVTVNFNGTVVTANIGKEQEIGKDELVAKWGSQDKDDPTVIDWTIRVNYARRVLNYVTLIDTMSDNQKLVDDYFVMNYVDSVEPWTDKGSAMELIKSMAKSDHGFEIKMDRLDRMVYIWYKTKLVNAVKDSTNPTNKVELKAENDGATSSSRAVLVGGKGDASGENKPEPTFEIPREAPKVEIPEEPTKPTPEKPSTPKEAPSKPVDAPKAKEVEITEVVYKNDSEPKEAVNTAVYGGVLPNTGEKEGVASTLGFVVIAAGITALTLGFKKYNEGEEE